MRCDKELDLRGYLCPMPVLKARKALLSMAPGQSLRVLADDPMAQIDLPNFCREAGHGLLAQDTAGGDQVYVIRRGPDTPPPG